jgi:hypothetical protein
LARSGRTSFSKNSSWEEVNCGDPPSCPAGSDDAVRSGRRQLHARRIRRREREMEFVRHIGGVLGEWKNRFYNGYELEKPVIASGAL